MLWPDYCLGASVILKECVGSHCWPEYVIERCFDFEGYWHDYNLLMTNSAEWALGLVKFFTSSKWLAVKSLVDVIISDLAMLRGTHSVKDRFIARLKKFLRLLDDVCVKVGFMTYVCLSELLDVELLRRYASILEAFKGEYHRVRNKVHELLYPHLHAELERLKEVKLWFSTDGWGRYALLFKFDGDKDVEVYIRDMAIPKKYISLGEAVTILKKIVERKERHRERQRLKNDEWTQLELLEPIPKVVK